MTGILHSIAEAAGILRMNEEVLRRWLREGRIRGVKVGHLWRVPAETLTALTHGRRPDEEAAEEEDEEYPSCVCFPRWLEFSGLPGLVTARHGPAGWNTLRAVIELDCQHNEAPGQWVSEPREALVLKTGLDGRTLERCLAGLKKDRYLLFRTERSRGENPGDAYAIRLSTPIKTPISVFEVDFRYGGLKNASSDYGDRSCVLRYIK